MDTFCTVSVINDVIMSFIIQVGPLDSTDSTHHKAVRLFVNTCSNYFKILSKPNLINYPMPMQVGPLDSKDSTHHKAKGLFVDAVKAPNVYAPPGSSGPNAANAKAEASGYAESLSKAAAKLNMARNSAGVPR